MHYRSLNTRAGFTLVEMLVVVAIITIVASLTAGAVMQVIGTQKNTRTEHTIRNLNGMVEQHWRVVVDQAKNEQIPASVLAIAGGPGNERRARIIWIKLRLKQAFPMNFSEALYPWRLAKTLDSFGPPLGPTDLPALQVFGNLPPYDPLPGSRRPRGALRDAKIYVPAAGEPAAIFPPDFLPGTAATAASADPRTWPLESAVCLALSLQQGRSGINFSQDLLGSGSLADAVGSLKMVVDAWLKPIVFYRWPQDYQEVDNSNPSGPPSGAPQYRDPLDPEGLLMNPMWNNWNQYSTRQGVWWFEQYCHPVHEGFGPEPTYRPRSWYTVPVIVSQGRNGRLGLLQRVQMSVPPLTYPSPLMPDLMNPDPTDTVGADDNIYGFRLRLGARGD